MHLLSDQLPMAHLDSGTGFYWDLKARRYRHRAGGRFVSRKQVESAFKSFLNQSTNRRGAVVESLLDGTLALPEWETALAQEIKREYLVNYALTRGGVKAMTPRDYGLIGAELKKIYAYIRTVSKDFQNNQLSPEELRNAVLLYRSQAQTAYDLANRELLKRVADEFGEELTNLRVDKTYKELHNTLKETLAQAEALPKRVAVVDLPAQQLKLISVFEQTAITQLQTSYVQSYAFGKGAPLNTEDLGIINKFNEQQTTYFRKLTKQLLSDVQNTTILTGQLATVEMSSAQLLAGLLRRYGIRLALYAVAGTVMYQMGCRILKRDAGNKYERRVLGIAEHCDDCVGYAAQGWQPIGTLPPPKQGSVCRMHCRCRLEYAATPALS